MARADAPEAAAFFAGALAARRSAKALGPTFMIASSLAVSLIGVPCGIAFGLALRSSAEIVRDGPGFRLFGDRSLLHVIGSALANVVLGAALFFGPSVLILNFLDLIPLRGYDNHVWVVSMLIGAGIGKSIRWWRWKKTGEFA